MEHPPLAVEPEAGGLPPEPSQGFAGRVREIAALEQALRSKVGNGIVVIHGYEGMGKTTLAVHVARRLVSNGRFRQVVYSDFGGGGHRESVLYDLGARLLDDAFDLTAQDAVKVIEQALDETPTLVIWDGMEALIEHGAFPLGAEALGQLLQLGARLASAGGSRLCVVSDSPALPDTSYAGASVSLDLSLGGLEEHHALDLLGALLGSADASRGSPEELADLVNALGWHPLALCVLSALLAERSLAEVTGLLEEVLPGLKAGEARLRNQALEAALQVFLRSFDATWRHKILALGVFAGGFMRPLVSAVTRLEEKEWAVCAERLSLARLLRDVQVPGLNVSHLRLHPSLSRHLSRRLSPQQRTTLDQLYCGSYMGLLKWLLPEDKLELASVNTLARCEMPNFRRALHVLLDQQHLDSAMAYAGLWQRFLAGLGFRAELEAVGKDLQEAIVRAVPTEGPLARPGVRFLLKQGEELLTAGGVAQAGQIFSNLCSRMAKEGGLSYKGDEATFDQAFALHQFGRCFRATGRAHAALGPLQQALTLLESLKPTRPVRAELVAVLVEIGDTLMEDAQPEQAGETFQRALTIATELEDYGTLGVIKAKLGGIAMANQDLDRARLFFDGAVGNLTVAGDLAGMANAWRQLGTIAWMNDDPAEAERCYRQALRLSEKAGEFLLQTQTFMQLAQVAYEAGRPHDAEEAYGQAIRICHQHNVKPALAAAEMALAELLLREGQLPSAKAHAEAARAILEDLAGAQPWGVYSLLQRIAEAEGDEEREAHWRQRTQEAFASSQEARRVVDQWRPLIQAVAKACRGEALDVENVDLLDKLETDAQWEQLASAIWRILGGERSPDLYATLDPIDAVVVRRILEAIESPDLDEQEERKAPAQDPVTQDGIGPQGLSFARLAAAVAAAINGDQQARSVMSAVIGKMTQEGSPEPLRQLGQALGRIMGGERDPSILEGLPDAMAGPLQALLKRLRTS